MLLHNGKTPYKVEEIRPCCFEFWNILCTRTKGILQEMEEAEDWERIRRGEYESRNIIADFIGSAFVEILNGIFLDKNDYNTKTIC